MIAKNGPGSDGTAMKPVMKQINADPEIYPPEVLADEEPRYLRRQKPLEIRRRKFGRSNWPAYRRWLLAGRRRPGAEAVWLMAACDFFCFLRASRWPRKTRSK